VPLDWESEHFQFPVAQLTDAEADSSRLETALVAARRQGIELVVWPAASGRRVPPGLLDRFAGALVDEKTTFARRLLPAGVPNEPISHSVLIEPYAARVASPELITLAIAAGSYSRFRIDPHFPGEKFEAMYRIWIERSVRHELADEVLVARDQNGRQPLGMITLGQTSRCGSIGLIAVHQSARGRGIGLRLVLAGLAWMRVCHLQEARVVTQRANAPACRLYHRAGFRPESVRPIYHFWPRRESRRQAA
jgi:dTDP-4-amino-4,6-dideoxy-D-galactose acyltransferase